MNDIKAFENSKYNDKIVMKYLTDVYHSYQAPRVFWIPEGNSKAVQEFDAHGIDIYEADMFLDEDRKIKQINYDTKYRRKSQSRPKTNEIKIDIRKEQLFDGEWCNFEIDTHFQIEIFKNTAFIVNRARVLEYIREYGLIPDVHTNEFGNFRRYSVRIPAVDLQQYKAAIEHKNLMLKFGPLMRGYDDMLEFEYTV